MTGPGAPHALSTFLPVGVADDGRIVLRQAPAPPYREAFLLQTLAAAGEQAPVTRLRPEALLGLQPALAPPALVLHTGRCGSTLLCRLLDATGVVATFREPDAPLAASQAATDPHRCVRVVLTQFSWAAEATGRVPVVKLSSIGTRLLDGLVPAGVPRVYVVRDVEPVVRRVVHDPPGWLLAEYPPEWLERARAGGGSTDGFDGPEPLDPATQQRLLDRAVERWDDVVAAAFEWSDREGALIVDYPRLVAEPRQVVAEVLAHLGVAWPDVPGVDEALAAVLGRHAKSGAALGPSGRPAEPPPLAPVLASRVVALGGRRQRLLDAWRAESSP